MDEKLKLNDGTEIRGHLLETETRLFLYMYDITMAAAFALVIDAEKTTSISWERYGQTGSVSGYNHLMSISEETGGMISASLKKG